MFALLVIASLLSSPVGQVVTGVEDSTITARIESLYLLDQHLNPLNINTTTRDGNVMISKVAGNHGSLSLNIQQTSDAHKFLLQQFNALVAGPPSIWAQGAGILRCLSDSTTHTFAGMCFQKLGDKPYQKQGQNVQWVILCGDIQSVPF